MTNRGLRLNAVLLPILGRKNEFLAPLNCAIWNFGASKVAPLALHLVLIRHEQKLYSREECVDLARPGFSAIKSSLQFELE